MQMKLKNKKITSLLLCMMLIVAMAFFTTGCNEKNNTETQTASEAEQNVTSDNTENDESVVADSTENEQSAASDSAVLGEGETEFAFVVVDGDGNETQFEIHTDKETVGDALLELGLIDGDEGEYGLYVKTVNGVTADYDIDQTYWAFYINDEYAQTGVDSTNITPGDTYSFKIEK